MFSGWAKNRSPGLSSCEHHRLHTLRSYIIFVLIYLPNANYSQDPDGLSRLIQAVVVVTNERVLLVQPLRHTIRTWPTPPGWRCGQMHKYVIDRQFCH